MRSAVDEILAFNRRFHTHSLRVKLDKLAGSPFGFFRGTFHVFADDVLHGPFRKWPTASAAGQIVGDLHTENFGTFRAITGEVVYDINDFDETTEGPYEYDLRRLATSLVVAALDAKLRLGDGVHAAEDCIRSYLETLIRLGRVKKRPQFAALADNKVVRRLLASAEDKSRAVMMKAMAVESTPGSFVLRLNEKYLPVDERDREEAQRVLPKFLRGYTFQDVAFRIAGCGSLGRHRYALLLGKGKTKRETFETLRLVEWKDSLDSSLDSPRPLQSKNRAAKVIEATRAFQVHPKRYLGAISMFGRPMQTREIGANDDRFHHQQFADPARFGQPARIFGTITARAHLLANAGKKSPRLFRHELAGSEDRFVNRLLAFAVAYTEQVMGDYEEFVKRRGEVAKAWT